MNLSLIEHIRYELTLVLGPINIIHLIMWHGEFHHCRRKKKSDWLWLCFLRPLEVPGPLFENHWYTGITLKHPQCKTPYCVPGCDWIHNSLIFQLINENNICVFIYLLSVYLLTDIQQPSTSTYIFSRPIRIHLMMKGTHTFYNTDVLNICGCVYFFNQRECKFDPLH